MEAQIASIREQVLHLYNDDPRVHAISVCPDGGSYGVYLRVYPGSNYTLDEVSVNIGEAVQTLKVHVEESQAVTPGV